MLFTKKRKNQIDVQEFLCAPSFGGKDKFLTGARRCMVFFLSEKLAVKSPGVSTVFGGRPKGWFSKRVLLADVPPERKPEQGYIRMFPQNEKPERGHVRMFPRTKAGKRETARLSPSEFYACSCCRLDGSYPQTLWGQMLTERRTEGEPESSEDKIWPREMR